MNEMKDVDIVIVTFNRIEKLQYALSCYDQQSAPFRTLIVVDNNSTDGTKEFLAKWEKEKSVYSKHVIYLSQNQGGSGGFYEGEKYALSLNPDWVYIADDDAYPEIEMMAKFHKFLSSHANEKLSAICSAVTYINGDIIAECRSNYSIENNRFCQRSATLEDYSLPFFKFNCLSYVGAFLSTEALRAVGLVNPQFFIYQDDVEHSIRLSEFGDMYCVPSILVKHDSVPITTISKNDLSKVLWKEYYSTRNRLYMLRKHYPSVGRKAVFSLLDSIRSHRKTSITPYDKIRLEGCKDAILGKLGIHQVYRPGLLASEETSSSLPYPALLWQFVYWFMRMRRFLVKK